MRRTGVGGLLRILAAAALPAFPALAQTDAVPFETSVLPPDLRAGVDRIAREVLATTGVPSASLAIVRDGRIAYVEAYGDARIEPATPARPGMRYSVGSISKQFTAAAILMLAEEHKLSLDDPVSRFAPALTRANEVTVRQLLSHTSGYQDYWPQDYVPPVMLREITAGGILDRWAKMPLDFDPGTQYQYSNTNYVIAGLIIEKASGRPFLEFLRARIFVPLGMRSVTDVDQGSLASGDPIGYMRYALGPPRAAPKEGNGWLFAAGELAMTARDLARWNVSLLERSLLTPASLREMETDVRLKNGLGTRYGLGVGVTMESGHRALEHGGEVSGFTAENAVFPDDRAAISVLTNQDSADAASAIMRKIAPLLFAKQGSAAASESRARQVFDVLQQGKIDRSLFTADANSYFTDQALRDFAASLGPLGKPEGFKQTSQRDRGGMTFHGFEVKYPKRTLAIWERDMPDGKIEQFQVLARD
jgi:CubicO group peptidase (beta-lactamase class C family)